MGMTRKDGRSAGSVRAVRIQRGCIKHALGSCLFEMGDTRVLCTVTSEEKVPQFLAGSGSGWVTAEYGMLPSSTIQRVARTSHLSGRSQEIRRLIGRSLRGIVDLKKLGERTLIVDCDVIQADGGTRTASVNGAFVALVDALRRLKEKKQVSLPVLRDYLGAVSGGIVQGVALVDLDYQEDSEASVDCNVVMTGRGLLVEVQATGEGRPFSSQEFDQIVRLCADGIRQVLSVVKGAVGDDAASLLGK